MKSKRITITCQVVIERFLDCHLVSLCRPIEKLHVLVCKSGMVVRAGKTRLLGKSV